MRSEFIEYDRLPYFNPIFRDYINGKTVFFENHFTRILAGKADLSDFSNRWLDRGKLTEYLNNYNRQIGATEATLHNIRFLTDEKTFAVVTGQQMGLAGGPMYTIYKIVGIIKTAEKLNTLYPNFRFVPVFWMENEDSDFREIRSVGLISEENAFKEWIYEENFTNPQNQPICEISLTSEIRLFWENIRQSLVETEFSESLFSDLLSVYTSGKSVSDAFAGWIIRLFGEFGLILYAPDNAEMKRILIPLFRNAILYAEELHQIVLSQSEQLNKSGYLAQVNTEPSYVYCLDESSPLNVKHLRKFRIRLPLNDEERKMIMDRLEEHPDDFIPNVLLRPLAQDTILPTIAYVAGPAEIAYMAQIKPLYDFFFLKQPYIIPRPTVTLVESKIEKILTKHHLDIGNILGSYRKHETELLSRDDPVFSKMRRTWEWITEELSHLRKDLARIDPSLLGVLDTTLRKMSENFAALQKKTEQAQKRKEVDTIKQFQKIMDHLMPAGELQERKLNLLYFLNKYGYPVVKDLSTQISIEKSQHQVIYF